MEFHFLVSSRCQCPFESDMGQITVGNSCSINHDAYVEAVDKSITLNYLGNLNTQGRPRPIHCDRSEMPVLFPISHYWSFWFIYTLLLRTLSLTRTYVLSAISCCVKLCPYQTVHSRLGTVAWTSAIVLRL